MKTKTILLMLLEAMALNTLSAQNEYNIEKITVINLGDGRMLFRDLEAETPLEGEHRIIDGYHSAYILAQFKAGLYDGSYRFYKNNKLSEAGGYKEGIKDGAWKEYYSDGETLKSDQFFKAGKADGVWKTYFLDGKTETEKGFRDSKEHGAWKTYDYQTGDLLREQNYVDGKQHGRQTGSVSGAWKGTYEQFYDMGKKEGKYCGKYENGTVKEEGVYKNDQKEGKWTSYRIDGKPEKSITYKAGNQSGETRTYFTDGSVECIEQYADGKRDGLSVIHDYSTGKVKSEIAYKAGKKEDPYKLYYPETGKVREEGRCENGREVYRKTYEYDGKGIMNAKKYYVKNLKWTTGWDYSTAKYEDILSASEKNAAELNVFNWKTASLTLGTGAIAKDWQLATREYNGSSAKEAYITAVDNYFKGAMAPQASDYYVDKDNHILP